MRSGYIPYVSGKQFNYKNRYADGVIPTILNNDTTKTLFVRFMSLQKISRSIFTGTEINILHRILNGVTDADNFFTLGYSDMCSYVDEWNCIELLALPYREIAWNMIYYIMTFIVNESEYTNKYSLSETIKNTIQYHTINLIGLN